MASTYTPNLNLQLQGAGDNPNSWGILLNQNVFTNIDMALGGFFTVSVAGNSDYTLSQTNALNIYHNPTGALTGNINYVFPSGCGRILLINNATSGAYTLSVKSSGGTGVVIPQNSPTWVYINPSTGVATIIQNQQSVFYGAAATTGTANAQILSTTVPSNFVDTTGALINFQSGFTNTGNTTINIEGTGAIIIYQAQGSGGGLTQLLGGELQQNCAYQLYVTQGGTYVLLNPTIVFDGANFKRNAAGQIAFGSAPTIPGTATIASGATLANGVVATTQAYTDSSTKVATNNFVLGAVQNNSLSFANGSNAVTQAATDKSTLLATTAQVASQPGVAKAYVNFSVSGGVVTVNSSFNVSSVTRSSAGVYVVNFASNFADTTYVVNPSSSGLTHNAYWTTYGTKAIGSVQILGILSGTGATDNNEFSVTVFK